MVIEFGSKLASSTLGNFKPIVGSPSVVSILSLDKVAAHEVFWIPKDLDTDIFGPVLCDSPLARKAFGNPVIYYSIPVFVHNSIQDPNGNLMIWKLTATLYDQLVDLKKMGDLNTYSISVTAQKQGQGTRTQLSIIPNPVLRNYWTPDFKQKLDESVNFWFECCDSTLYSSLSEQELIQILASSGYDFQTNSFPNRLASGSYFAKQAVGSMFAPNNQVSLGIPQSIPTQVPMQPVVNAVSTPVQPVQPQIQPVVSPLVAPVQPQVQPMTSNPVQPQVQPMTSNPVQPQVQPVVNQVTQEAPVSVMSEDDINSLFDGV